MNAGKDTAPLAGLTILKANLDKHIFGGLPLFKKIETVRLWLVLLKFAFGLPLDDAEWELAKPHTNRTKGPSGTFSGCRSSRG